MSEEIEDHVLKKFNIIRKLGKGAYGVVWEAQNKKNKKKVALKKIYDAFQNSTDAQRTYREVMYLQQLNGHENIIRLLSIIRAQNNKDLYLVFDLMETDLHVVIRAGILKSIHKKFILYQLFKALYYLHSAELVHRDLKPSNMLINSDCVMKLADFGLARSVASNEQGESPIVSDYIATRWYRAPEILLGSQSYCKSVDMWSAGCILGETLIGEVMFAGKSSLNQMEQIIQLLGKPSDTDFQKMNIAYGNDILDNITTQKIKSITRLFEGQDKDAIDLLRNLLQFNPQKRLTAKEALNHVYFKQFHSIKDEIECKKTIKINLDDNQKLSLKSYRDAIYQIISQKIKEYNSIKKSKIVFSKKKSFQSKQKNKLNSQKQMRRSASQKNKNLFNKKKSLGQKCKGIKPLNKKMSNPQIYNKLHSNKLKQGAQIKLFNKQGKKSKSQNTKENLNLFKKKKSSKQFSGSFFKKKKSQENVSVNSQQKNKSKNFSTFSSANMQSYFMFKKSTKVQLIFTYNAQNNKTQKKNKQKKQKQKKNQYRYII